MEAEKRDFVNFTSLSEVRKDNIGDIFETFVELLGFEKS